MKNKYLVPCGYKFIDVYRVCSLFCVFDPGIQHAIKKLLFSGHRGHKSYVQDLEEAIQSIRRSIDMYHEDELTIPVDIEE